MKKKTYEKVCPICGQRFIVVGSDAKEQIRYCSRSCSEAGHRRLAALLTRENVEMFSAFLLRETVEEYRKNRQSRPEIENFVRSSWFQSVSFGTDPEVFLHLMEPEENEKDEKRERR